MGQIHFVHFPQFDEIKPENVINVMQIEKQKPTTYKRLLEFCPELKDKKRPKDREFFFNILNTLIPKCVDRMGYNALVDR